MKELNSSSGDAKAGVGSDFLTVGDWLLYSLSVPSGLVLADSEVNWLTRHRGLWRRG